MQMNEIIVVEGLHDKQAVDLAVKANVWVIGGDRIARHFLAELRRASQLRGVIVFTDPDGTGERIRRRIDDAVPGCKHAFLSRQQAGGLKSVASLGIEHASPEDIRTALCSAKQTSTSSLTESTLESSGTPIACFTMEDLEENGLVGARSAAARRTAVGEVLGIGYGNAKAFLRKLNVLGITQEEFHLACSKLPERRDTTIDDD